MPDKNRRTLIFMTAAMISASSLMAGCKSDTASNQPDRRIASAGSPQQPGDGEVIDAQTRHEKKVEVTVCAPVKKLLPPDTKGLPHERFLLQLSNGTTCLIAHDVKMAPPVPVNPGDKPIIHGEYIWNKFGGVIHWTHHSNTPRHEGGWIELNGQRYQ